MSLEWWLLVAIGVLLITAEIFIGAFVVLWFGIGAVLVGLLTLFVPELHAGLQILFAVQAGVVLLYFFRDHCVAKDNGEKESLYTFTGGPGVLRAGDDGHLSVSARGTYWAIANIEVIPEAKRLDGTNVEIDRFENNRAVLAATHNSDKVPDHSEI